MRILKPSPVAIQKAAEALQAGNLVVIPTETVYGLAADAMNPEAVRKVFAAKERPPENPLIVHIADLTQLESVAGAIPDSAKRLMKRYWPGALTLVLPKKTSVPAEVTAGLDTVAIRMPSHPVALEVIRVAGMPLAAPSANRFMHLSPTRAENVERAIAAKAEMILDGGPCQIGLESTVLDCTEEVPRILRPGGVTRAQIQAALGYPLGEVPATDERRSPGMYSRHYAPQTPMVLVAEVGVDQPGLVFGPTQNSNQISMPKNAAAYSAALYDVLHRLDQRRLDEIYVQLPPETPEWEAVLDRLRKASEKG
jgi:L-threonylcarbamoyladenylate synthase